MSMTLNEVVDVAEAAVDAEARAILEAVDGELTSGGECHADDYERLCAQATLKVLGIPAAEPNPLQRAVAALYAVCPGVNRKAWRKLSDVCPADLEVLRSLAGRDDGDSQWGICLSSAVHASSDRQQSC